jgi:hypothetical protein
MFHLLSVEKRSPSGKRKSKLKLPQNARSTVKSWSVMLIRIRKVSSTSNLKTSQVLNVLKSPWMADSSLVKGCVVQKHSRVSKFFLLTPALQLLSCRFLPRFSPTANFHRPLYDQCFAFPIYLFPLMCDYQTFFFSFSLNGCSDAWWDDSELGCHLDRVRGNLFLVNNKKAAIDNNSAPFALLSI